MRRELFLLQTLTPTITGSDFLLFPCEVIMPRGGVVSGILTNCCESLKFLAWGRSSSKPDHSQIRSNQTWCTHFLSYLTGSFWCPQKKTSWLSGEKGFCGLGRTLGNSADSWGGSDDRMSTKCKLKIYKWALVRAVIMHPKYFPPCVCLQPLLNTI
jgi:hypothetical protein